MHGEHGAESLRSWYSSSYTEPRKDVLCVTGMTTLRLPSYRLLFCSPPAPQTLVNQTGTIGPCEAEGNKESNSRREIGRDFFPWPQYSWYSSPFMESVWSVLYLLPLSQRNPDTIFICHSFRLHSLFWKNERRLMRSPCCLCIRLCLYICVSSPDFLGLWDHLVVFLCTPYFFRFLLYHVVLKESMQLVLPRTSCIFL
jgi:hypothetical protein